MPLRDASLHREVELAEAPSRAPVAKLLADRLDGLLGGVLDDVLHEREPIATIPDTPVWTVAIDTNPA